MEDSSVDSRIVLLSVSSGWMDIFEVLALSMTESGGRGGLGQGLLQLLELYRLYEYVGHLAAPLVAVIGMLDVSPDGDDTSQCWHLQKQISLMQNRQEHGECRSSQEGVVVHLEISNLKLQVLYVEVFLSPKGHGKSDLTDGSQCCSHEA
jgi:hypothetical protein